MARVGHAIYPARGAFGVPMMLAVLIWGTPQAYPCPFVEGLRSAMGWTLLALGLFLRIWGVACWFRRDAEGIIGGRRLMTDDGPYAYVRNPRYLGNLCLGLGAAGLVGGGTLLLAYGGLWLLVHLPIMAAEKQTLTERFGLRYQLYCEQVPMLLPRLRGAAPLAEQLTGLAWTMGVHEETGTVMGWLALGLFVEAWRAASLGGGWAEPGVSWLYLGLIVPTLLACHACRKSLKVERFDDRDRPMTP
jgi:protein-S-isoprenylcysteine O-methyltransferase Ste14